MEKDPKNLAKYQKMYKYAYLLSDGVFKIVFTEEKSHSLLISLLNAMLDLHGGDAIGEISLEMQEFPGIFNYFMDTIRAKEVTVIREEKAPFHIDGDPVEMEKDIHIQIVEDGLRVLVEKRF